MKHFPLFAYLSLTAIAGASGAPDSIGFEQPGYPLGPLSDSSWSGPAGKTVTDLSASAGSQSLAISGNGQRAEHGFSLVESATSSVVSFDFQPSAYQPPVDINHQPYGIAWVVANTTLVTGGVRFYLEDWDSFPWHPAPADAFKVKMVLGEAGEEVVGNFVPGTWYHYEAVINWADNTYSQTLSLLGGSAVASRSHTFTATGITSIRFYSPQTVTPTSAYIDQIFHGAAPAPQGYGSWSLNPARFTAEQILAGDNLFNRDPDRDGRVNLMEYALDGNPNLPDAASVGPRFHKDGDSWSFDFTIPTARNDLVYITEWGDDLSEWSRVQTNSGDASGPIHVVVPPYGPTVLVRLRVGWYPEGIPLEPIQ